MRLQRQAAHRYRSPSFGSKEGENAMKINWKARFQNKTWLVLFVVAVVGLAYKAMDAFGFVPPITQEALSGLINTGIGVLVLLGVVVDPTTSGASDSARAMTYGTDHDAREEAGSDGKKTDGE